MNPVATVLVCTALLGSVSGAVGSFAVLRRRALVGDLLAHAALPGVCLAFVIVGGRFVGAMVLGALATGLAGVGIVTLVGRWTRIKDDAAIGIVLSTFFGAGVALSSVIQRSAGGGGKAGLERYIYGQAAGLTSNDLAWIAAVALLALTLVALLYKEFKLISFDPAFARAQGWPTLALDLTMMGSIAAVTVVGLQAVGVVLMAALLITPPATARLWTNRLWRVILLAMAVGAAAGIGGTLLSSGLAEPYFRRWLGFDPLAFGPSRASLPTGPLVVLCGTAMFVVSLCVAPQRGLLARAWSAVRLRRRVADENLLRTLYELSEPRLPSLPQIAVKDVLCARAWSPWRWRRVVGRAERRGLVGVTSAGVQLTERGLVRAAELTRRHRLWELFLIQGAKIAADHVDRDADSIEHALPVEVVQRLESELAAAGRLPRTAAPLPSSPHELPGQGATP